MLATVAALVAHPIHGGFRPFWPMFIIGPVIFLIIVGLVVALIMVATRRRHGGPGPWGPAAWHGAPGTAATPAAAAPWASAAQGRGAEQILADRFAKGDIDEAEYRARLEVLRAERPDA